MSVLFFQEKALGSAQYSHCGFIPSVDVWNIHSSKEVTVHAVYACHVVKVCSVVEKLAGIIGDEVPIHHRSQFQQIHDDTWER